MSNFRKQIYPVLLFLMLLLIWQLLSLSPKTLFLFGSPITVVKSFITNTFNGVLPYDFLVTGFEAVVGFVVGTLLGTLTGFALWYSPKAASLAKPYLVILGAIPVFSFAPLIIIWFGIGISMKIALAAFSTFLISLAQSYEGAKSVDEEETKLLRILGASRLAILQKVVFPSSLSWVLASLKLNIGFALLGAFIGEFISAERGLGHFMIRAGSLYDIPTVLAGGIYLVLLSLGFGYVVSRIDKKRMKIIESISVDSKLRRLLRHS